MSGVTRPHETGAYSMKTEVQAIGDALGVRLPKDVVQQSRLEIGSELEIYVEDGRIMLTPVSRPASRLEELVAQITDENRHELLDWGPPVGGEVW